MTQDVSTVSKQRAFLLCCDTARLAELTVDLLAGTLFGRHGAALVGYNFTNSIRDRGVSRNDGSPEQRLTTGPRAGGREMTEADEAVLLAGVRASPADSALRLVYADFLEERDRPREAAYLRASAAVAGLLPGPLKHDDQLPERLRARALLRPVLAGVGLTWLRALGDPGLVGEVLHAERGRRATFNTFVVVLEETEKTCLLGLLQSRRVRGGVAEGWERPVLPSDAAARRWPASPWCRARKHLSASGETAALSGGRRRFVFWGGADVPSRQG
jgi:uncharacterized protein (TIGR02996 family)